MKQYPYFNNMLFGSESQIYARFDAVTSAFIRLIENDPSRQADLWELYYRLPDSVKMAIRAHIDNNIEGYKYIVARHDIDRRLSMTRGAGVLDNIYDKWAFSDDWHLLMEYLENRYSVVNCPQCNRLEFDDEITTSYEDDEFCRVCMDESYRYSDYYDAYVSSENSRWALDDDGQEVLVSVDDDNFCFNEDCDRYTHVDYVYEEELIARYHSSKGRMVKQPSAWTALKKRYIGVELEVEINRKSSVRPQDKAKVLNSIINDNERGSNVYFERDGSLNNGFEIITQPMGLDAHAKMWGWLNNKDATRSLLSHNTTTCGLHVHISKMGMTKLQIAKIVSFINDPDNEDLVKAVARRYAEGYCRIKEKKIGTAAQSEDRYEAVNITGRETIEFRIFKGSLKYESVLAAIQFSNALVEFCGQAQTSIQDLKSDKFIEWINAEQSDDTNILRPYLEQRLELA